MKKNISKLVLFRLGDTWWSMPLSEDSQFVSFDKVVSLPIDNKMVSGLIYNSGRMITVLNTNKILGMNYKNRNNICFIFYIQGDFYALHVDEGGETVDVDKISVDKNKKTFKEYTEIKGQKVYILRPEDIWLSAKI